MIQKTWTRSKVVAQENIYWPFIFDVCPDNDNYECMIADCQKMSFLVLNTIFPAKKIVFSLTRFPISAIAHIYGHFRDIQ